MGKDFVEKLTVEVLGFIESLLVDFELKFRFISFR